VVQGVNELKVAIHQNKKIFDHSTSWSKAWIDYCIQNNIDYEIVNCYENNILQNLKNFDCLLWHFGNYVLPDMLFARSILNSAEQMGLKVFPDHNTSWHFDDKIAQMYLLQSINAPIPDFWVFYTLGDCLKWIEDKAVFPLVAKLRSGSGSNNVKLVKNKIEAISYAKKMFSVGFNPSPKPLFKTKSNILSAKNFATFFHRFKRIPDFIETMISAKQFPNEKNYVFFQEFIPNGGFDIKIIVVKDKLSYVCRKSRGNDFRASGSGDLFYNQKCVSENLIDSAFNISEKLNLQCMGYDFVVNNISGAGKIVEMSYGFSHVALMGSNGYWDKKQIWNNDSLNAPNEALISLL